MRCLVAVLVLAGCGSHDQPTVDAPGSTDGAVVDADQDGPSLDAPIDAALDGPTPCTTYAGVWRSVAITFTADVAPATHLDFEHRGDGVTPAVAGTPLPRDEYLACCGVQLDAVGTDPTVRLIWAGNAVGGFEVRAACGAGICTSTSGVRATFVPPATAVGANYQGGTDATVFDAAGAMVAAMSAPGSGLNFLGYEAAVPIRRAEYVDGGGENLSDLFYHRCAP